jgi:hypothetical protein
MDNTSDYESLKELISDFIAKDKENLQEQNNILIKCKNNPENNLDCLLEILQGFLASPNINFRKNSMKIISLVIERVLNLKLDETRFLFLFKLAVDKLKDVTSAPFNVKIIYCMSA